MFTGIIEEVGSVERFETRPSGAALRLRCSHILSDLALGHSINVNGVCLTTAVVDPRGFAADISPETLRRSNLGRLRPGDAVNLERALSPQSRLGGHLVQGHVDGTGELVSLERVGGENWWLKARVPAEVERYAVFKGSIAIDGISLTIASLTGTILGVAIVTHTYENTNLRSRRPGDVLNLECDIIAKYVEKSLASLELGDARRSSLTEEKLKDLGF